MSEPLDNTLMSVLRGTICLGSLRYLFLNYIFKYYINENVSLYPSWLLNVQSVLENVYFPRPVTTCPLFATLGRLDHRHKTYDRVYLKCNTKLRHSLHVRILRDHHHISFPSISFIQTTLSCILLWEMFTLYLITLYVSTACLNHWINWLY